MSFWLFDFNVAGVNKCVIVDLNLTTRRMTQVLRQNSFSTNTFMVFTVTGLEYMIFRRIS